LNQKDHSKMREIVFMYGQVNARLIKRFFFIELLFNWDKAFKSVLNLSSTLIIK
jgi:hypothetical protein